MTPSPGKRNLWCGIAASVSALLLWAAYPPHGETFAILVALVPMLVVARLASPRRSALFFFLFGLAFWVLTLSWMPAIIKNNGPWPLVLLGWFALSAACAGYFAAFGFLAARLWRWRDRRGAFALASVACIFGEAALWTLVEYLRATLFTGFAWNFLGTAFASMPSFASPARFGGVYLVSALVVLLNGVFATLLMRVFAPVLGIADRPDAVRSSELEAEEEPARWGQRALPGRLVQIAETGLPLAFILACLCVGSRMVRGEASRTARAPAYLRVALVQRNAPCLFRPGRRENAYEAFGRLLDAVAAAKPDVVVLAESAMSEFGAVRSFRAQDVARGFLDRAGAKVLIAGGDDVVDGRTFNAVALYARDGEAGAGPLDVYHKQHLVPFGEYIPFDKWITPLQKLSPVGVSLHPGEPGVFTVRAGDGEGATPLHVAPLICYEDTDPRLAARAKRMGADLIVLVTNDSWFSNSAEAEAHAAQAVLRAIETGLPIVRVGNSGVTGVIRPDGSATWLSDSAGRPLVDAPGVMVETVAVR